MHGPLLGRMDALPPAHEFYTQLSQHGRFDLREFLSEYEVLMCVHACERLDKALLPRNRNVDEWHEVERITLFQDPTGLRRLYGLDRCSPTLANIEAEISTMVRLLGVNLGQMPNAESTQLRAAAILASYYPTRLVINIMNGTLDDPALIRMHTDPLEESGVVAVVVLDTLSEQPAGTLSLYACQDLVKILDTQQPLHGVTAYHKRYSLAFTDWPSDRQS